MKATTRMMKLGLMMKVTTRKTKLSLINYLTNETRFNDELGEKERKEESQGQISYMSIKILFCSQDDISYTKILPSCKNEKSISKPSQEKLILCENGSPKGTPRVIYLSIKGSNHIGMRKEKNDRRKEMNQI